MEESFWRKNSILYIFCYIKNVDFFSAKKYFMFLWSLVEAQRSTVALVLWNADFQTVRALIQGLWSVYSTALQ